jgi:autotransporter-associated beta strand protein
LLDLGGFNNTIKNLTSSAGTITNSTGSATLRIADALSGTLTTNLFTGSLGLQIYGGGTVNSILGNASNNYSGGTILGNGSGTTTTRWLGSGTIGAGSPGAVTSGIFGTGAITIGATTSDRSQLYFAGATTVNNGIVVNSAVGAVPSEIGAFRVESTGSIIAGAINANLADATFNAMNTTGRTLTVSGAISGSSGLRVTSQGAGGLTVTLSNTGTANSYAGDTTIDGNGNAVLALGAANQIANGAGKGNLVISNARFDMRGFSETINGLSGSGTVDGVSGTPTLTVGDNNATSTFSGRITNTAGTLALTKIGTGTLTLSGANTYTGALAVSGGVLGLASTVGGAAANAASVSVASNATLILSQSSQVNNSAVVTLSGGTIQRGSGVSEVFGNLNVSSASFLDFGNGATGALSFGLYTGSALLTVNNFFEGNVLTFGNDLSGSIGNTNSFQFDNAFTSSWNQGTSTFTITAIPEPSTYFAAVGVLGLLLLSMRRYTESRLPRG